MNLYNFVRSRVPIVDIVQEYTSIKPIGGYWKGPCPFHNERTGSFTVTPAKEIFYCFGCHAKGDVIAFVALSENCTQFEAAKLLADRYKLAIDEFIHEAQPHEQKAYDEKKRYFDLMRFFAGFCHQQLKQSKEALAYLQQRGITDKSIELFQLGYLPRFSISGKKLSSALQEHSFTFKELLDAHIIAQGQSGLYSPFEERILFPIHDHLGRVVAFGGRVFRAGDERPKYYNSKEHELFNKSGVLYGFHLAKKPMQSSQSGILVEGYLDCITMVQHGFLTAVATLGTAVTSEHLKMLSRLIERLYVTFDGDSAGQKAMLRLTQLCWEAEVEMRTVLLPHGDDPASFLQRKGDLKELLAQAPDIFEYFTQETAAQYSQHGLKGKMTAIKHLLEVIASIRDPLKRDIILQQAAQRLGLPIATLYGELRKVATPGKHEESKTQQALNNQSEPLSPIELHLIKALSSQFQQNVVLPDELLTHLHPAVQEFFHLLKNAQKDGAKFSINDILVKLNNAYAAQLFEALSTKDDTVEDIAELIHQAYRYYWKAISAQMKQEILQAQEANDTQAVEGLLAKLQTLRYRLVNRGGTHG